MGIVAVGCYCPHGRVAFDDMGFGFRLEVEGLGDYCGDHGDLPVAHQPTSFRNIARNVTWLREVPMKWAFSAGLGGKRRDTRGCLMRQRPVRQGT